MEDKWKNVPRFFPPSVIPQQDPLERNAKLSRVTITTCGDYKYPRDITETKPTTNLEYMNRTTGENASIF